MIARLQLAAMQNLILLGIVLAGFELPYLLGAGR